MDERENAIKVAHAVLDQPWRDPDDDISVLARQLLRANEAVDALNAKLSDLYEGRSVIIPSSRDHAYKINIVAEAFLKD